MDIPTFWNLIILYIVDPLIRLYLTVTGIIMPSFKLMG